MRVLVRIDADCDRLKPSSSLPVIEMVDRPGQGCVGQGTQASIRSPASRRTKRRRETGRLPRQTKSPATLRVIPPPLHSPPRPGRDAAPRRYTATSGSDPNVARQRRQTARMTRRWGQTPTFRFTRRAAPASKRRPRRRPLAASSSSSRSTAPRRSGGAASSSSRRRPRPARVAERAVQRRRDPEAAQRLAGVDARVRAARERLEPRFARDVGDGRRERRRAARRAAAPTRRERLHERRDGRRHRDLEVDVAALAAQAPAAAQRVLGLELAIARRARRGARPAPRARRVAPPAGGRGRRWARTGGRPRRRPSARPGRRPHRARPAGPGRHG